MFRKLSAPISVQWELTPTCNLNCVHCYNYWRNGINRPNMVVAKDATVQESIVNELIENGVFQVTLTGGEPLIVLSKNMHRLTPLKTAGIDLHFNSNLALLSDEHLGMLRELGVRSILTSLMAHDAHTHNALSGKVGSFEATCAGIHKAVMSGFRVAVNMVITKKNLPFIRETGRLVKLLGAVGFCATKASKPFSCADFSEYYLSHDDFHNMVLALLSVRDDTGLDIDSLDHYPACAFPNGESRLVIGNRSCSAGKTGCTIGFDGLIRPCSQAQQSYGAITDGLQKAWFAMDEWRNGTLIPDQCKKQCGEFPMRCGGGCRVEAFNCTGKLNAPDPYCVGGLVHERPTHGTPAVNVSGVFTPASNLRFRREDSGTIVYLSVKNWLLVDDTLAGFLNGNDTVRKRGFCATDLASAFGVSIEQTHPTLRLLVSKKLVNEGDRESKRKEGQR